MNLTLVIGDKNLSSWSLRPWLAARNAKIAFKEQQILLDRPETSDRIKAISPTGRVPALIHDKIVVWDSLAICEYLFEIAPSPDLWPADRGARAHARSISAEMHSGFSSLRQQLSMDVCLRMKINHLTPDTISDIRRIVSIWNEALKMSGGPFLFGRFTIADAFYAPVIFRFQSYGINIQDPRAKSYMETMLSHPDMKQWATDAAKEESVVHRF